MDASILPPALLCAAVTAVVYSWYRTRYSVPLPPGPKGLWLLGNALEVIISTKDSMKGTEIRSQIAKATVWYHKITEYTDQYGPLIKIRLAHQLMFVVSDPELITELFEKRATNYSDRYGNEMTRLYVIDTTPSPSISFADQYHTAGRTGWDHEIVLLQYGPQLKRYRTMLNRTINNRATQGYIPSQQHEVRKLMKRLVENPEQFLDHFRLMTASTVIRIAYGYKIKSFEDPFIKAAEEHMKGFDDCVQPWKWVVNAVTPLRYLPDWLLIAPFQRRVKEIKCAMRTHREKPFAYVQEQISAGTAEESFTAKLLQPEDGSEVDESVKEEIKLVAGAFYAAGSDTSSSIIQSFFLAMTLNPEVQARAQKEIDSYLRQQAEAGTARTMLGPEDQSNLPYTSAVMHELHRWHPVAPVFLHRSGPHDDNNVACGGKVYHIPARTPVLTNVWKITHNPAVYEQPDRFMPERYLVENPPPDPENYTFGFGRRICPGLHIAQQLIWISISNLLANFTIAKSKDTSGSEITPEELYSNTTIIHPLPFVCSVTPRGKCEELLEGDL